VAEPDIERQADERSREWERRYLELTAGRRDGSVLRDGAVSPSAAAVAPPRAVAAQSGDRASPAEVSRPSSSRTEGIGSPANRVADREEPIGPFVAYTTNPDRRLPLVVAPIGREWMERTRNRFAFRCLPMLIANQAGWLMLNAQKLTATWDGGEGLDALRIEQLIGEPPPWAKSHFGSGILTFSLPYLFRTPPGYNLHVRGPSNWPKDGVCALEGVVETDWTEATFTMNWKLTRANHAVVFEVGEPIAMIIPQRRGELERFRPEIRSLPTEPALDEAYRRWSRSRAEFNRGLKEPGSAARKAGWQRHYMHGKSVNLEPAPEHQRKLELAEFADEAT